jgi:ribonuclease HI
MIVTDSDYLFRAITDYVFRWEQNGYLNARGLPVTNGPAFKQLHRMLCTWEANRSAIRFWRVPREQNSKADSLAKSALDGKLKLGIKSPRLATIYLI